METVIAMGIITIMVTAFLAAFGPAVQGIRKSMSAKEANRLATTLEHELSVLRYDEHKDNGGEYTTSFEKAYEWIKNSGGSDEKKIVLLYQYRGNPNIEPYDDGSLKPLEDKNLDIAGKDYVLQSVVRLLGDDKVQKELAAGVVEGRVFYVRMTQLVFAKKLVDGKEQTALTVAGEDEVPGGKGKIIDPTEPRAATTTHEDYPEAVIAFQAEFYVLKSSIYAYVNDTFTLDDDNGDGHPDAAGKPVFTRNMAIRR
ncbi:MAG: hypothetical protein H7A51_01825 [Akkermansiaceae bacterium]|nr:hypothetical protein [Akkermansiaceae bacterium]